VDDALDFHFPEPEIRLNGTGSLLFSIRFANHMEGRRAGILPVS
jgi:hypothetical protein